MDNNKVLMELMTLPEKQLKQVLDKPYINKGTYVVISDNYLYKVLFRSKNQIIADNYYLELDAYNLNSQVKSLTYDKFLELKKNFVIKKMFPKSSDGVVKLLHNTVSKIYSEDRFDITFNNLYNIIIHYPEINITNSLGETHIIRDLYLRLKLFTTNNGTFNLDSINIIRTTFSYDDVLDNKFYIFSHTYSNSNPQYWSENLCFGITQLNTYIHNYKNKNISLTELQSLLFNLESYLSWESLEGVPYVKINTFLNRVGQRSNESFSDNTIQNYYKCVIQNISSIEYKFNESEDGLYNVVLDNDTKDEIREYLTSILPDEELYPFNPIYNITVLTAGWGEEENNTVEKYNGKSSSVIFKGVPQTIHINRFPTDKILIDVNTLPKKAHNYLVEDVAKLIESNLYKFLSLNYAE